MTDKGFEKDKDFPTRVKESGGLYVPNTKIKPPVSQTGEKAIQDFLGAESEEEALKEIDKPAYTRKRNPPKGK